MKLPAWHEEPIARRHDRVAFDCGDNDLNEYVKRFARKNHDHGGAKTFLAIDATQPNKILGFYSLSPASMTYVRTPKIAKRSLARYEVPVYRLGYLAVDRSVQGAGLGGQLLLAAGRRCLYVAAQVGGVALLIDAKNERVAEGYSGFGAVALADSPLSLLLPLKTIHTALTVGDLDVPAHIPSNLRTLQGGPLPL